MSILGVTIGIIAYQFCGNIMLLNQTVNFLSFNPHILLLFTLLSHAHIYICYCPYFNYCTCVYSISVPYIFNRYSFLLHGRDDWCFLYGCSVISNDPPYLHRNRPRDLQPPTWYRSDRETSCSREFSTILATIHSLLNLSYILRLFSIPNGKK